MMKDRTGDHDVKRTVLERQVLRIVDFKFDSGDLGAGLVQEFLADIDANELYAGSREYNGKNTGPATDLQYPLAGLQCGHVFEEVGAACSAYLAGRSSPAPDLFGIFADLLMML